MSRRAFTLIEMVLASTLAGLVVLGCMGAFFALDRTDRVLAARYQEASDLARVQRTMQRAFSTLLMAPTSPNDEVNATDGQNAQNQGNQNQGNQNQGNQNQGNQNAQTPADDAAADDAAAATEVVQRPRILLEPDLDPMLASMLQQSRFAAGGGGSSVSAPQRLELVLSSVPIRPPSVQSTAWADALVGVDDLNEAPVEGEEKYAGVRGDFALRPDDPTGHEAMARVARNDFRTGWTLWWQPLDDRSEPARIASGLASCHFQMFYQRQMLDQHIAYAAEELPAYVQLEVETLSGLYASYLFEVVWTVDELEEDTQTTNANGNGGNNQNANGGGGGGGGGGFGGPGGPGNRRGGGEGDAQRQGRPRPQMPQGAGPGQRLEGRPQGAPRPGGQRPGTGPGTQSGGGNRPQGPGGGGNRPQGPGGGGS